MEDKSAMQGLTAQSGQGDLEPCHYSSPEVSLQRSCSTHPPGGASITGDLFRQQRVSLEVRPAFGAVRDGGWVCK